MTIRQKQCLLAYLGYYTGNIDGDWGAKSAEATREFQKTNGLTQDGNFGVNTEKAAISAVTNGKFKTATNRTETSGAWKNIKYFTKDEFACQCGGKYCNGYPEDIDMDMVRIADEIRHRIGKPIPINSGLRCEKHNARVGGVSNSQHRYGTAADLGKPAGVTPAKMAEIAETIMGNTGGIGVYPWGVHIDTRKTKSRWNG